LHLVRGSRPSPADLRAIAQGPSSAPRVRSNPFNPRGQRDEWGDIWGVWNPALVGLPIDPGYAYITQFIKDVYLDSQVTVGLLSNVTASIVQLAGEKSRPPRNAKEAQRGEILTAAQTAAARNFINEISGSRAQRRRRAACPPAAVQGPAPLQDPADGADRRRV